eukprot:115339-Amorphochlora_amoeboformis.AAC.2
MANPKRVALFSSSKRVVSLIKELYLESKSSRRPLRHDIPLHQRYSSRLGPRASCPCYLADRYSV